MQSAGGAFDPESYSDRPLYNIQAIGAAVGVSPMTLRSWERRYGVPAPARDAGGVRLYSERDRAIIIWLTAQLRQGVSIGRAVRLLQVRHGEGSAADVAGAPRLVDSQVELLAAIDQLDEAATNAVVGKALASHSVEDVALELLQPVLYEIGARWASGRTSVTVERFASQVIRAQLGQLIRLSPPPVRTGTVLVGCAPGELHDLGALMFSLFLRRRGYGTIYAGANLEAVSLIRDVRRMQLAALCLSASRIEPTRELAAIFNELHQGYSGILAFGGRVFEESADLVETIPGLYLGNDAAIACTRLETALSAMPSSSKAPRCI